VYLSDKVLMSMVKNLGKWFIVTGSFMVIMYALLKFMVFMTNFSI
jgi:hypothetical protein